MLRLEQIKGRGGEARRQSLKNQSGEHREQKSEKEKK